MNNDTFLIIFICFLSILLIGDIIPPKALLVIPLLICVIGIYLIYYDNWHNDSGAVG